MTKKKYDVVVVGELNVDLIFDRVEKEMEIGKEIIADEMTLTLGSSSAIFASNLSTLGAKVTFLGKVGNDSFANTVNDSLKKKGVDISNIIVDKSNQTGITVALNYDNDRAMVTYPGAMDTFTITDIDDSVLLSAKHMHFSSAFLQKGIKPDLVELFKKAKSFGLTTSFDPQWDPDEKWELNLEELLQYIDVFLPNIKEIQFLTKTTSLEKAIEKVKSFANLVVIKDGSKGSYLWNKKQIIKQSIFENTDVADCIGAGDSFNAGFIRKFINEESVEECLKFGSLTGAINTTKAGGTAAFKDLESVSNIALNKFNQKI